MTAPPEPPHCNRITPTSSAAFWAQRRTSATPSATQAIADAKKRANAARVREWRAFPILHPKQATPARAGMPGRSATSGWVVNSVESARAYSVAPRRFSSSHVSPVTQSTHAPQSWQTM